MKDMRTWILIYSLFCIHQKKSEVRMRKKKNIDLPSVKQGLLIPNCTIYGRWFAGHYTIPVAIIVVFVFTKIPWDVVYLFNWYQTLSNNVAVVSNNINIIPATANPFPEYSMAFLSFINVLGPIYALISIYCGLRHVRIIKEVLPARQASYAKLFGLLIGLILAILILLWGVYHFSGESTIFSNRFYKSEWRFVSLYTFSWIFISMLLFGATIIVSVLFNRYRDS